ncbi:hypothetical protein BMW23_0043 [Bodo saltans virus]|uniref:Uncharacterized protein n=1 Tax=Bodo saltans virus TaxID=2024608 RepID=A0A2H4UTG1_9VIRU|nr:hypothetical protein QJ851_gp0042 [Bodo saltans virus]ATZ80105.1 hypothetical protein BMW23_0043 [Bodo saltans virus]
MYYMQYKKLKNNMRMVLLFILQIKIMSIDRIKYT